jgi:ankyrin repeat protein
MKFLLICSMFFCSFAFAQTKATQKLFTAIEKNNLDLARSAVKEGADVNGVDNVAAPTTTTFLKAVKSNRLEIVKLLLDSHADINQQRPLDLFSGLMITAKHDYAEMAKELVDRGANVNLETVLGRTALHVAALNNSFSVAQILVSAKDIDVNARPDLCAMAVAARQGFKSIVLLLKKQVGFRASSPVCLDKAIELAKLNNHEEVSIILNRH